MKVEKSDQTDEGYDEQKFEEPDFMKDWSDERKAGKSYASRDSYFLFTFFFVRVCISAITLHTRIKNNKSSRPFITLIK